MKVGERKREITEDGREIEGNTGRWDVDREK